MQTVNLYFKRGIKMLPINTLKPNDVFKYFEQLSAIPRGSGNMQGISQFCVDFAKRNNLKFIRDNADNVIIYKEGTAGYELSAPIILQGHLDMVCQKTPDYDINFEKDGLDLFVDGDFLKASGTTLGADNGIAVAMILAILESNDIVHPPIEAVFTTDEEIGMIGARALDMSILKATSMINLDSEEDGVVTVSCAGGSDFKVTIPLKTAQKQGQKVIISINGLKGGHSGVEIHKGRVNADILGGRILNHLKNKLDFDIIALNGGDKPNAIPNGFVAELCVYNSDCFCKAVEEYIAVIKSEICDREQHFNTTLTVCAGGEYIVFDEDIKNKIIYTLLCVPDGVCTMSAEIDGLVETSLNLGVLQTNNDSIILHFALRSNKQSSLKFLEEKLAAFFKNQNLHYETFGHYPPWEYRENSPLRELYCDTYCEMFKTDAKVEAIHAGLECGVFAGQIKDFDCISIGPELYDVHTTREKLSITSTEKLFNLLIKMLEKLK